MKRDKSLLARAVSEVCFGFTTPLKVWGPYLLSADESVAPELQDRIFPIYFGCLLDMVEAKDAKLPGVIKEARESGFEMLARNAGVIATKCAAPIPYIGALSTDEQALLVLTRDRFVHGYLDGTTKPSRNLKLLIEDQVRSRPFSRDYLTNLTGKKMSLDMIRRLRWKFFSSSGDLWSKLQELFVDHDWLEQALMDDWPIYLDSGIK